MRITTHPGEMLAEEFMKPHQLSAHRLATDLRVPATRIGEILNERRAVTPDTALRLGRYFGTTAQFWLNLQAMYDLSKAEIELRQRIDEEVRPLAVA